MATLTKNTEWEGERTRLVKLGGLRRHPNFPYGTKGRNGTPFREMLNRQIEAVFVHALMGGFKGGMDQARALANFCTADPKYKTNEDGSIYMRKTRSGMRPKLIGGGRGWPGAAYTFLVPYRPEVVDGKFEVYRLWDDQWRTFHTGGRWNGRAVAVGFGGSLNTRHAPRFSADRGRDPTNEQFEAGTELILEYLLPRYGLDAETGLKGHFEAGKPTCPGDILEAWVRLQRGEDVNWLEPGRAPWDDQDPDIVGRPRTDRRPLDTWQERQEALLELDYDLGKWGADGVFGLWTRRAVEAFQEDAGIIVDGIWGDQTELHVRRALAAQAQEHPV